jgi:hypothetical protein
MLNKNSLVNFSGNFFGVCVSRTVPEGAKQFEFEFPIKEYRNILITTDEQHIVCYCFEKLKVI